MIELQVRSVWFQDSLSFRHWPHLGQFRHGSTNMSGHERRGVPVQGLMSISVKSWREQGSTVGTTSYHQEARGCLLSNYGRSAATNKIEKSFCSAQSRQSLECQIKILPNSYGHASATCQTLQGQGLFLLIHLWLHGGFGVSEHQTPLPRVCPQGPNFNDAMLKDWHWGRKEKGRNKTKDLPPSELDQAKRKFFYHFLSTGIQPMKLYSLKL